MSEDWIKIRKGLPTDPRLVRISSALRADRLRTLGALVSAWFVFDTHSEDGSLSGYTPEVFDEIVGLPGLAVAMASVGWMEITPQALIAPRFEEHNGATAKRRAQENRRKASARDADKLRTAAGRKSGPEKEKEKEYSKSTLLLDSESVAGPVEPSELPLTCENAFQKFWESYPRKKDKPAAERAFGKGKCAAVLSEILAAIERARRSAEWADPQFIPYPATWLNARGWEDEVLPVASASNPVGQGLDFGPQKKGAADFIPGLESAPGKVLYDGDLREPDFDWRAVMGEMFENPNTEIPWGHVLPAVRAEVEAFWAKKKRGAA